MLSDLSSAVYRHLVRSEELAPHGSTVLFGEQGQKSVADFKIFNYGAETWRDR